VLIDVAYANTTFVETQIRAGTAPFASHTPPFIPGNGVGGVVAQVGDGVDPRWVGKRVIAGTAGSGGYAERVTVDVANLVAVPDELALPDAVALLADGRTAIALVRAAALTTGEWVLVEAAAGGVGSLLTQLCVSAGARVVAAARGTLKLQIAEGLGAEVTVDYSAPKWAERVRERTGAVKVVFDGVGGAVAIEAFGLLTTGGRMLSYGLASGSFAPISDVMAQAQGVRLSRGAPVAPEEAVKLTKAALDAAIAGRLTPRIGQRFALERATEAHAAIESRATTGKTLLEVR
jgi:NADPH2:quinone reductase